MVNNFPLIHPLLFHLKQFEKRKCEIWIIYIKFYYLPDQLFIYFRIINFFRAITFCLATEIDEAKQFFCFLFPISWKNRQKYFANFLNYVGATIFWQTDARLSRYIKYYLNFIQHVTNSFIRKSTHIFLSNRYIRFVFKTESYII